MVALERRLARPPSRTSVSATASRSAVVTPGATIAAQLARAPRPRARSAARIRSSSAGDLQTITRARSAGAGRRQRRRRSSRPPDPPSPRRAAARRRSTRNVGRAAVVLDERLGLRAGTPSAARRTTSIAVVVALHQRAAALARTAASSPVDPGRRVRAALRADPPRRQPPHQLVLRHRRCRARRAGRGRPSSGRAPSACAHRPRKAVEHEPAARRPARPAAPARSPIITSSRTRLAGRPSSPSPRRPSGVPACTASRRMSPVEIFGSPSRPRAAAPPACPCRRRAGRA